MERTVLAERKLPDYTRNEEIFNMASHIVGGAFGVLTLVMCLYKSINFGSPWQIAGGAIFGLDMILLYTMSSIYHGLRPSLAKKVFQVIDHCTIYFLIAGSYTPILLTGLRNYNPKLSWTVFSFVWIMCIIGTIFTAIDLKKYNVFSMICYLGMGWSVLPLVKVVLKAFPFEFFVFLFAGGFAYTFGVILYGIGSKRHWYHSVFHIFVVLGSVLQFVGIYLYCV